MTINHKRKYIVLAAASLVLICSISLCAILSSGSANADAEVRHIREFSFSSDYPTAEELNEMVNSAEVVVVGEYMGFDSSWNMARNPNNISDEDEERYVEGRLYSFNVEDVLKGNLADETVLVNHKYSETRKMTESNAVINAEGIIVTEATVTNEISFTLIDALYIEPEIGVKYVLFLAKDNNFGNYYGSVEPFIIKISDDNIAYIQSNLINSTGAIEQVVTIDGTSRTIVATEHTTPLNDNISGIDFELLKDEIIDISTHIDNNGTEPVEREKTEG
jgi:hypothetical protein